MPDRKMHESWMSFREVMLKNVSNELAVDFRIAFFSGAVALMSHVMRNISEGDAPTDDELRMLASIDDELIQFNADIERVMRKASLN